MCMGMHMTFYWGVDATILFSSWHTRTLPQYCIALALVALSSIAYEGLNSAADQRGCGKTRAGELHCHRRIHDQLHCLLGPLAPRPSYPGWISCLSPCCTLPRQPWPTFSCFRPCPSMGGSSWLSSLG
ncbi:hypothetical protein CLOM_g6317 [Closterium sp. NIES-68]|nr:hypothetical protein CLOM_g6317 [Closterium sp. NIES-68]